MIKTTLVGLGKIGYLYDRNNTNLRISHFSSLLKDKRFKIVSVVEKKNKIVKNFKRKSNLPVYKKIENAIIDSNASFLVIACDLNFKSLKKIIIKTNIKYILVEKPFNISKNNFKELKTLLKKKKIFFLINFQRNFYKNYVKLFNRIKNGFIGDKLKCYCFFNDSFENNGSHLLYLVLLLRRKFLKVKKIDNKNLYINFKKLDVYFLNIGDNYNNNSITIFGNKGKIDITSRPEIAKMYIVKKDKKYSNKNILQFEKKTKLYEKYPQKFVLDHVYNSIKKNQTHFEQISEYLKIMQAIKKL